MRSSRLVPQFALVVLASATLAVGAQASPQGQGFHTDKRFGFKLKPPPDWEQIPIQAEEEWLVAKYLSKRKHFWTEKGGWTYEHQPELMVIAFVEELTKKKGKEVSKVDGDSRVTFRYDNPYKNYEDYLDRTYRGGGFFISKREKTEVGDVEVTKLEIKVEKLARGGPKRITTWIYHAPEVDFAVQIEVLENSYKKLKRTIASSLRSFKLTERTEGALPTEAGAPGGWTAIFDMDEGTPDQRRHTRQESAMQLRQKALDKLPEGWTAQQVGRVFVLSHVKKKYSGRIADQANAVLKWLEDTFPFVGPEEYVRDPIIRICKDQEEESAYRRGGNWFTIGIEITTNPGTSDWFDFENEWVNKRLLQTWFQDRDRDLYWALPRWLSYGLNEYVADLHLKGRKLEAKPDSWDKGRLRDMVREGTASSPRNLMNMSAEAFTEGSNMWGRKEEAGALVRFLMSPQARKKKQTRNALADYMKNLAQIIDEIGEVDGAQEMPSAKPTTEAEEEELYKKRREGWKLKESELLEKSFFRTFGRWSAQDWKTFEKAYFDTID
jgi:hypothetical protein